MSEGGWRVGVLGATGPVGTEVLRLLDERAFPLGELRAWASDRSAGGEVEVAARTATVAVPSPAAFEALDLLFACAPAPVVRELGPHAARAGAVVIDLSGAFRDDADVPLVLPGVNAEALEGWAERRIVAVPGPAATQLGLVLAPLADRFGGLRRVTVTCCQGVGGSGRAAVHELERQSAERLNGRPVEPEVFDRPVAFNVLPVVGVPGADGRTDAERSLTAEVRRVLADAELAVAATVLLVPAFHGLGQAVHVETTRPASADEAREVLDEAAGVDLLEEPEAAAGPDLLGAAGGDEIQVGRLRADPPGDGTGLAFWSVADDLRRGAALGAVEVAEHLVDDYL